jgi:hypothetical protein
MARNKITDLRDHLFEVIEKLKEGDDTMPIERAQAIAEVSKTIIDSARVEVEYIKVTGQDKSDNPLFMPVNETKKPIALNGHAGTSTSQS